MVNGETIGRIISGRGLQQGDPLSPYLFIIYAEGLSSHIRDAEEKNIILVITGVFGKLWANSDYYKRDRIRNLRTCCAKFLIENGLKRATKCTQVT